MGTDDSSDVCAVTLSSKISINVTTLFLSAWLLIVISPNNC